MLYSEMQGVWTIPKSRKTQILLGICSLVIISLMFGFFTGNSKSKAVEDSSAPVSRAGNQAESVTQYDSKASVAIKEYLYAKYGGNGNKGFGVSWFDSITNITVMDGAKQTVKIDTTLTNNDQGKNSAQSIANAVLLNGLVNADTVQVTDKTGAVIASKTVSN